MQHGDAVAVEPLPMRQLVQPIYQTLSRSADAAVALPTNHRFYNVLSCSDFRGSRSRRGDQSNIAQRILAQDEAHVDVARKVVLRLDLHGMLQL